MSGLKYLLGVLHSMECERDKRIPSRLIVFAICFDPIQHVNTYVGQTTERGAHQCNRSACKNADKPSMMQRMKIVSWNHIKNMKQSANTAPIPPESLNPLESVMSQSTSESCVCASESAQRRRYDAVFEIHPRQNSIVWMIWWIATSPSSKCCSRLSFGIHSDWYNGRDSHVPRACPQ
jgi:hypothetical protein